MNRTLVLTLVTSALAGCALDAEAPGTSRTALEAAQAATHEVAPPTLATDGAAALAQVDANLERLRALDVFEVGAMLANAPEGALNCYGVCPGFEADVQRAREQTALRLARFAAVAEAAVATPAEVYGACAPEAIDHNVAALQALSIVEVAGLVRVAPANNPNCYNLPCEPDRVAAEAQTCEHAARLANIAAAAAGL